MTKEELIELWKAKKIAIQNEPKEAMVQVFHLLGVTKLPPMNGAFYIFCEDEYGWTSVQKIRLRKIKAPTALKILSKTEPKTEPKAMTKEEFISKWRNKEIAIENDHAIITMNVINLLGGRKSDECINPFYTFCDNEYGWDCRGEIDLPTIKATEALEILTAPESIPEATTKIMPTKFSPTAASAAFKPQPQPQPQPNRTPEHYRAHLMQPHDMLVKIYGPQAVGLHLRMSAFEYRMRAGYKDDSASDLAKAMHCEAKAKELEGAQE